jgi:hypothetical protein
MPDTQDLSSTQASSSLSRATTSTLGANSVIFQPRRGEIQLCGPPMDPASGVTMMELKDSLMSCVPNKQRCGEEEDLANGS